MRYALLLSLDRFREPERSICKSWKLHRILYISYYCKRSEERAIKTIHDEIR